MRVSVTRFRVRGRRLADHDIENSPHLVGEIALLHRSFRRLGSVDILELRRPNVTTDQGVMARLFEPRLIAWHNGMMLFRGFESAEEDGCRWGVIQEWRVRFE